MQQDRRSLCPGWPLSCHVNQTVHIYMGRSHLFFHLCHWFGGGGCHYLQLNQILNNTGLFCKLDSGEDRRLSQLCRQICRWFLKRVWALWISVTDQRWVYVMLKIFRGLSQRARGIFIFVICIVFFFNITNFRLHKTWIYWWHRLLFLSWIVKAGVEGTSGHFREEGLTLCPRPLLPFL